jgi:MinD superfamily P-loop ATPase
MAIECKRCGDPMMLETVIKLRRGVLGFRETRSQGAYCATCEFSVPMEAMRPSIATSGRLRPSLSEFLPAWLRAEAARSDRVEWV